MAKRYIPRITYRLKEIPIKQITVWKTAQARKLDRENISELAKSIKHDGLINPPMVQRVSKKEYLLMSGQRRLAAMKRLGAKTIPVHIIAKKSSLSLEEAKASSVVENIHRNDMARKDIVDSARLLEEKMGKVDASKYLGVSRDTMNKYLGFAAVPVSLRGLVPGTISRDDMTRLYLAVPNIAKARRVAERISNLESGLKKQYLKLLCKNPKMSHPRLLKLAKSGMVQQNISCRLTKTAAKKLKKRAERRGISVKELVKSILEK